MKVNPPSDSRERKRDIRNWWARDPAAATILPRDRAPVGLRTPNGFVWAHELDEIVWMPRVPGTNVVTVWSRSMLRAHGEPGYNDALWANSELVKPRVVRPWPVLRVLGPTVSATIGDEKDTGKGTDVDGGSTSKKNKNEREHEESTLGMLNAVDRGCKHEHRPPAAKKRVEQPYEPIPPGWLALLGECPDDPDELCTGPLLANVERLASARGQVYTYLWCEHFRASVMNVPGVEEMLAASAAAASRSSARTSIAIDAVGICIHAASGDDDWEGTHVSTTEDTAGDRVDEVTVIACDGASAVQEGDAEVGSRNADQDVPMPDVGDEDNNSAMESSNSEETENGETDHANGVDTAQVPTTEDRKSDEAAPTDTATQPGHGQDAPMSDVGGAADGTGPEVTATEVTAKETPAEDPEEQSEETKRAQRRLQNEFTVSDLPKLEEFIPEEYMPDVLLVYDPHNATMSPERDDTSEPLRYVRVWPERQEAEGSDSDSAEHSKSDKKNEASQENKPSTARLYLSKGNRMGMGNHSYVYRAPLTLPPPLAARSPTGQVTVAAKLAYSRCTAHNLLHNEAQVYNHMTRDMQEEWCGYNVVPQCRFPVPVGPTVPKFYGFYAPEHPKTGKPVIRKHPNCSEDDPCTVTFPSPILLMEECGEPVTPGRFTLDQRTECFSLLLRLHHAEIIQGSFYVRNVMIQPGPLSRPPEERSLDTPSFRIIDFGRGMVWEHEVEKLKKRAKSPDSGRSSFVKTMSDEAYRARDQLLVERLAY